MGNLLIIIVFIFGALNQCLTEAGGEEFCKMKTEDNKCCAFPFVYRGTTYNACTLRRGRKPWCSLSPNYDVNRQYGYCKGMEAKISGDDQVFIYVNGKFIGVDNGKWKLPTSFYFPANLQIIGIYVKNRAGNAGFIASFGNGLVSDASWKCTTQNIRNWPTAGFDDKNWPAAVVHSSNSGAVKVNGIASDAKWIGTRQRNVNGFFCRRHMTISGDLPMVGGSCDKPLGLQNGWVQNSQMTASSAWTKTHAAWRARLFTPKQYSFPGAWCSRYINTNQWIQVAFYRPADVTAIATQGRANYNQWVTSFTLSYSEDGTKFTVYSVGGHQKVFTGNSDRNTVVKHNLVPRIGARFIKVHPKTWYGHISMRMELYGCLMACKVDIGILMDESGSVSKGEFEGQKNFVKTLAGRFELGPSAAQMGVITYSTGAQLDIPLNQFKDVNSFVQRVNSIKRAGGWTYTGKALQLAYKQLFVAAKGARANVAKVLLVITDGKATGGINTIKAPIKLLKDSSVNIISVGVGKGTGLDELRFMASSPTNSHLFSVENTNQLGNLIGSITASSCTSYNCRYVTCDYSQWSKWSVSCGIRMRRTRRLVKVNKKYIKQQGGCSGLQVSCNKVETETKNMNCPCISVTCSWSSWGSWSSTCGRMTRQRVSNARQNIIHRPNCIGLQTSCPSPEAQSIYISCCKGELGILMDESGSIGKKDFETEKGFVTALANGFSNFGPNGIQMAVITYSTSAQLDIKLDQYSNKMEFINAVKRINYYGGWTFTGKAFTVAKNQLFQSRNGARPNVSKILIALTDGEVTGGTNTLIAPLANLEKSNVNIFAIGVGNKIKKEELDLMASQPVKDHVFFVANMQELQTLLQRIGDSACKKYKCKYVTCEYSEWSAWSSSCGTGMRRKKTLAKQTELIKEQQGGCSGLPTTCDRELLETKNTICPCKFVTCTWNPWGDWSATCGRITRQRTSKVTHHMVYRPNCIGLQTTCPAPQTQSTFVSCCKVDLGVVMDESGSIRVTDFRRQKEFVAALAKSFNNFGPNGVQMGLITFSFDASVDIKLNQFSNKYGFMAAVRNIRQRGGNTNTDQALNLARTQLFTLSNGARPLVSNIVLVITDGSSTGGIIKLLSAVEKLKSMKVNIISIGIGPRLNRAELEMMASDPKDSHLFFVRNAGELKNLLRSLVKTSCQVFKCKYMTCDYSVWSAWSTSCGKSMRRKKTLTNQTEHVIEQQGGCSGFQTICDKELLESKDTNCSCKSVTCSWKPWTEWSASCGLAERIRSIQETNIVVQKPNCSGLPQTCTQPPQKETRKTMCTCPTVQCIWKQWSNWSATCGKASRTRSIQSKQVTVLNESCDGLPQSCPQPPETENKTTNCACPSVNCTWLEWSSWTKSCGVGTRMRDIKETVTTVKRPSCAGLPQKCTQQPQRESRKVNCMCPTVKCRWNDWTDWSATCGLATRNRTIKTIMITVQKLRCDGLPQSCPQLPQKEQRTTNCTCKTVNCEWESWSSWSKTCGIGTRTRKINETVMEVLKPDCSGLPQSCPEPPQYENREIKCSCPTVNCTWSQWSDWSATCGPARRQKTVTTRQIVVQNNSCDGLPQSCPAGPITENRTSMCACHSVNCSWGAWGNWSGLCGMVNRTRHIVQTRTTIQAESCDGVPTQCNQQPENENNKLPDCEECYTVKCSYNPWSAWSASCGNATRRRHQLIEEIELELPSCDHLPLECPGQYTQEETRNSPPCSCKSVTCSWKPWTEWSASCGLAERIRSIQETNIVVQKPNCSGLPQTCTQPPQKETRKTMCTCPTVQCIWKQWSNWSATCGKASRTRSIQSKQVTVLNESCDGLPQSCPQPPETENKRTNCACPSVNCTWLEWSSWTKSCGVGTRMRDIKETVTTVNRPTCAGLPQKCTQQPQRESRKVNCTCPRVECRWNDWTDWSATCGLATRNRTIKTIMITVQKLRCDGLPQSCPQLPQKEQRTTNCTCKTVNCAWQSWSSWSKTCGIGTRTRKINETVMEVLKPDCSGLPQSCPEPPQSENREIKCSCPTVNCTWSQWSDWSATCGPARRQKTVTTQQIVVQNNSCDGLPQSCPAGPITENRTSMCACHSVNCSWGAWGNWSGLCGMVNRTRHIVQTQTTIQAESCDGVPTQCNQQPENENNKLPDCEECYTVKCSYNPWSAWSASCGNATRRRHQLIEEIELELPSCDHLPLECPGQYTQEETRNSPPCSCKSVTCSWKPWTEWSASCGLAERIRSIQETNIVVQKPNCSGLPQTCTQPPQKETRKTMCTCPTVQCIWKQWSNWSATCGKASRTRSIQSKQVNVLNESCDGLPQSCPQPPETENKTTNCACPSVNCTWLEWSSWTKSCGIGTRMRDIKETVTTVNRPNCTGLPQKCTQQPQSESQKVNCTCPTVECRWNDWTDWSATCGLATRNRTIKTIMITVQKLRCDGLPQSCPQLPQKEQRTTNCTCKTINCEWESWSSWSKTCGIGTRTRKINETVMEVLKPDCSGLPQSCPESPQSENREIKCNCPTVNCTWSQWSDWSATCGPARRQKTVTTQQIVVQNNSCDGLPQSCPAGPITENRTSMCACQSVNCSWGAWGNWSGLCGMVNRTRHIVETQTTIQAESCDGVPTKCNQQPENENNKLPDCEECYTVKCSYNPWSAWSASCGNATRRRYQLIEEIELELPSCHHLPLECPGQYTQEETRNNPPCSCKSVTCSWKPWTEWSASCGLAERIRSIQETNIVVQKPNCSGLPQTCTQRPQKETRKTMCTCPTVQCIWKQWSNWSATCGKASRTRSIQSKQVTVLNESCHGLPQSCPQPPETENKTTNCACASVNCTWLEWSSWTKSCGVGTRMRNIKETVTTVNRPSCAGLPQKCTQQLQSESRKVNCTCPTVECRWNDWTGWSATCGLATRNRTIKTIMITVQKLRCDGLPQSCPQLPQKEQRTTNCTCKTVNCEWESWSSWSKTCGIGTRTRKINETVMEVLKPDCSGLPQSCPESPQSENREIKCNCPTFNCTWSQWSDWSATCGPARRQKTVTTQQIVVQNNSCDGLPQSCPAGPITENRTSMCACQSVNCSWGAWGNWSGLCGMVNRTRHIVETQTTIQAESCDGVPTQCNQQPENENNKLPDCEECYTVKCSYNPWSAWSASCGNATRRRFQLIEEIELELPSCDHLPLECPGQYTQEETRNNPPCPTVEPSPSPATR